MNNKLNLIMCCDKNAGIGFNGKMPWHFKKDMIRFRNLTRRNVVIMGYNTWLSIGSKPLPERINIIITNRDTCVNIPDDKTPVYFMNFKQLLVIFNSDKQMKELFEERDIFVIGGNQLINTFLNHRFLFNNIYLTRVSAEFETDCKLDCLHYYIMKPYNIFSVDVDEDVNTYDDKKYEIRFIHYSLKM
jgi:dihydrofolate reductase